MLNYQRVSLGINLQSSDLCRCQIWQNGQMLRLCRKQSSPSQYRRCLGRSLTNSTADEFELVAAATALIRDREKATRFALLVTLLFLFRYVPFDLAMLWKLCEIFVKLYWKFVLMIFQWFYTLPSDSGGQPIFQDGPPEFAAWKNISDCGTQLLNSTGSPQILVWLLDALSEADLHPDERKQLVFLPAYRERINETALAGFRYFSFFLDCMFFSCWDEYHKKEMQSGGINHIDWVNMR